jgi:hypothetical protein
MRRGSNKPRQKDCGKKDNTTDFSSTNQHKAEMMLEKSEAAALHLPPRYSEDCSQCHQVGRDP